MPDLEEVRDGPSRGPAGAALASGIGGGCGKNLEEKRPTVL